MEMRFLSRLVFLFLCRLVALYPMRAVFVQCVFGLLLQLTASAEARQSNKLQSMRGEDGLVHLTDIGDYREFVLKSPKPYQVFVMFTSEPKFCRVCVAYERVFQHVALSYLKDGKEDVVFTLIELSKMQEALHLHGIKHMPLIVHVNHQTALIKKKSGELQFRERDQFAITKLDPPAGDLLEWANGQSGKSVRLYFTPGERFQHLLFVSLVLVALGTTAVGLVLQCRKRRWLVITLPVLIQYVATSGIFFNMLNHMHMFGPDGAWILQSPRGQYLGEGLAMSGLMVGGGLSLLLAIRLPWLVSADFCAKHATVLAVATTALIAVAIAAVMTMLNVYRIKTGWYQDPPFFPPDWFKRGPVRIDQGNSF